MSCKPSAATPSTASTVAGHARSQEQCPWLSRPPSAAPSPRSCRHGSQGDPSSGPNDGPAARRLGRAGDHRAPLRPTPSAGSAYPVRPAGRTSRSSPSPAPAPDAEPGRRHGWRMCYSCSRRCSPPLDSTPRAYRLKVGNAAPHFQQRSGQPPLEPTHT
jgi:hypothetical protein